MRTWLIIAVALLSAYSFGANCVERFVNYQSWPKLKASNFADYHKAQQPYIFAFIVAPLVLELVLAIALLMTPGAAWIPISTVWTIIAASVAGFLSTALLQIPLHRKLDQGYSEFVVRRLLVSDWIRKAADVARVIATVALLYGGLVRS